MGPRHNVIEGMKRCTICEEVKPISEYAKCVRVKSGLRGDCKQCRIDRNRAGKYGLTMAVFYKLMRVKKCQICGARAQAKKHSIDHDHVTGKVRGILCTPCNQKLGWFENNSASVLRYLKEAK